MSKKNGLGDLPIHSFSSAAEFENFLEQEHGELPGFYLKIARKSSGIPTVSADEAIEVALCFGWINGQGKSLDEDWYLSRYTTRRPRSLWSQRNVEIVQKLSQEGRMRPAGLAAVEAAKEDGRWERAYAKPSNITVPKDFAAVLATNSTASSFFQSLNKTNRYLVLLQVQTASPSSRAARINTSVEMLAEGNCPGPRPKATRVSKDKNLGKSTVKRTTMGRDSSSRPHKSVKKARKT